jgi:hypothetical protein
MARVCGGEKAKKETGRRQGSNIPSSDILPMIKNLP